MGRVADGTAGLKEPSKPLRMSSKIPATSFNRIAQVRLWATLKAAVVSDKGLPYPLPAGRYIVQQPFRHRRRKAGISCIPIWPIASSLKVHNKPCFEKDRLSPEFVDKFVGGG